MSISYEEELRNTKEDITSLKQRFILKDKYNKDTILSSTYPDLSKSILESISYGYNLAINSFRNLFNGILSSKGYKIDKIEDKDKVGILKESGFEFDQDKWVQLKNLRNSIIHEPRKKSLQDWAEDIINTIPDLDESIEVINRKKKL